MEKRKDARIKKRLMVKINNQAGILIDISRTGFKLSTTNIPNTRNVSIILQNGEQTFNLQGHTRWITRKLSSQKLYDIGVALKEAPDEYYRFLEEFLPTV